MNLLNRQETPDFVPIFCTVHDDIGTKEYRSRGVEGIKCSEDILKKRELKEKKDLRNSRIVRILRSVMV